MARKCKVCLSNLRSQIDSLLMQDYSFKELAQWCDNNGLQISETSLKNHAHNHITDYKNRSGETRPSMARESYQKIEIDYEKISDELGFTEDKKDNAIKGLEILLEKQILLTYEKQKLYSEGKVKFPMDEFRGLKILLDSANSNGKLLYPRSNKSNNKSNNGNQKNVSDDSKSLLDKHFGTL